MSSDKHIEELLERNRLVAQAHVTPFHLGTLIKDGTAPKTEILVVTCADPRCDPSYFFATKPGEAIILRNMGGCVQSLMPDILAVDVLVRFKHILVVHHTDCGASLVSEETIRTELGKVPGADQKSLEALILPVFTDDKKSVLDDLSFLKNSPLLRKELAGSVWGFLLDTATGLLNPVV